MRFQVRREPHVHHAVGPVEHQHLDVEGHALPALRSSSRPAWRQHVHAPPRNMYLGPDVHAGAPRPPGAA
jgi:hypothetical protein